jgi:hypothetical protein
MDRSTVDHLEGGSTVPLMFNVFAGAMAMERTGDGTGNGSVSSWPRATPRRPPTP